jgi:hypothetical protein
MNSAILPRRGFLRSLIGLIAAPAIVRIENLMPVKRFPAFLYKPIQPLAPGDLASAVDLGDVRFRFEDVYTIYKHYGYQFGPTMRHFPGLAKEPLPPGGVSSVIRALAGLAPPPSPPIGPRLGETEAEYLARRAIRPWG